MVRYLAADKSFREVFRFAFILALSSSPVLPNLETADYRDKQVNLEMPEI